jgi:hypothetical protein
MTRVPRTLVATLLSLALLGGCGGSASRDEFRQDVVDARDRVDAGLEQATEARDFDELLDRLEIAAVEIRKAATDLSKEGAPGGLRDEKRALEDALRALSEEIIATVETLDGLGPNVPITRGLTFENWEEVQARLEVLRTEGIDVAPLDRHGGTFESG